MRFDPINAQGCHLRNQLLGLLRRVYIGFSTTSLQFLHPLGIPPITILDMRPPCPNAGTNSRSGSDLVAPFQDSWWVPPDDPDRGDTVRQVDKQVVFASECMHMHVAQTRDEKPATPVNHMRIGRDFYVRAGSDISNALILDNDSLPFQDALTVHGDDGHIFKHDRCVNPGRYFFLGNTRFDPRTTKIGFVDIEHCQSDNGERSNDDHGDTDPFENCSHDTLLITIKMSISCNLR